MEADSAGRWIAPMVTCPTGKLAVGTPNGRRSYGVNGRDYAYNLYPSGRSSRGESRWLLRHHEVDIATFKPRSMYATDPVPVAAALVCFTLMRYGVPGGEDLGVPRFHWMAKLLTREAAAPPRLETRKGLRPWSSRFLR